MYRRYEKVFVKSTLHTVTVFFLFLLILKQNFYHLLMQIVFHSVRKTLKINIDFSNPRK